MNKDEPSIYEGFEYRPEELRKFILAAGIFTIKLKKYNVIIHHTPDNVDSFKMWLLSHGVEDINAPDRS